MRFDFPLQYSMEKSEQPEIVIIAAIAEKNRVIGNGLDLPWRIPEDLRRFKRLTLGHPVLMGRRTFESLMHQFGGPLKGRPNLVLTRSQMDVDDEHVHVFPSLHKAIEAFSDREVLFVGGGASVYEAALPLADRMELTLVEGNFKGDTFFPPYEQLIGNYFELVEEDVHIKHGDVPGFRFCTYRRTSTLDG